MRDKRESVRAITEILGRFDLPYAGNVWEVQGTPVIYHKALEEIADKLDIVFQMPTIIRAERDECVLMVVGTIPKGPDRAERTAWSIGEALVGGNYKVSGKQSSHVYAMAEKRAKDRVILKLLKLGGHVYAEGEDDEFARHPPERESARQDQRQGQGRGQGQRAPGGQRNQGRGQPRGEGPSESPADIARALEEDILAHDSHEALAEFMLFDLTRERLDYLAPGVHDEIRRIAVKRMRELGWTPPARQR